MRVIAISLGVNLIATAIGYYFGGANAALSIFLLGVVLTAIGLFWPKKPKPEQSQQPPNQTVKQEASPHIEQHAHIGDGAKSPPSQPSQAAPQKPAPVLDLVELRSGSIVYDRMWLDVESLDVGPREREVLMRNPEQAPARSPAVTRRVASRFPPSRSIVKAGMSREVTSGSEPTIDW